MHNANELDGAWQKFLMSPSYVLDDILVHEVSSSEAAKLKNGIAIEHSNPALPENDVFIVSSANIPIAICLLKNNKIKPSRVFNL